MTKRFRSICCVIVALLSLMICAYASGSTPEFEKARLTAFEVRTVNGVPRVEVRAEAGYCVGEPPPRLFHASVRIRGRTPEGLARVIVIFWIERPAPLPEEIPQGEVDFPICSGRGHQVRKVIAVSDPERVAIFDGSVDPARRVPRLR